LCAEAAQLGKVKALSEKERDGRRMRGIKMQQIDEKRHPAEGREHLASETTERSMAGSKRRAGLA